MNVLLAIFPVVLNTCRVINTLDAYLSEHENDAIDLSASILELLDTIVTQNEALDATSVMLVMDYILRLDRILPLSNVSQLQITQLGLITKAYVNQSKDVKNYMKSQRYISLLDSPLMSKIIPYLVTQQCQEVAKSLKGLDSTKKRKTGASNYNVTLAQSIRATSAIITLFEPIARPTCIDDIARFRDIIIQITCLSPGTMDEAYVLLGVLCSCTSRSRQSMYDQDAIVSWNDTLRPLLFSYFSQVLQTMQYLVKQSKEGASEFKELVCLCIDSLFTQLIKHQNPEKSADDLDLFGTVCSGIRILISDATSISTVGAHFLRALSAVICALDYKYFYQDNALTVISHKFFQEYQSIIAIVVAKDVLQLGSSDLLVLADCCRVVGKFSAHDGDYITTYEVSLLTIRESRFNNLDACDSQCIDALLLLLGSMCLLPQRLLSSSLGLPAQLNSVLRVVEHVACQSYDIDLVLHFDLCLRNILLRWNLVDHSNQCIEFIDGLTALNDSRSLNCVLVMCRLLLEYVNTKVSAANAVIDVAIEMFEFISTRSFYVADINNIIFYCGTMKSVVENVKKKSGGGRDVAATHQSLLNTSLVNSCCYMATYIINNRVGDTEQGALEAMSIILKCMEALLTIPSCSILFTANVSSLLTVIQHTIQLLISHRGSGKDEACLSCARSLSKVLKIVATSNELMKHAYIFVVAIITIMSESKSINNSMRDVLHVCIFCLLEKCTMKEKSLIVSQLSPAAKVLYSNIHLTYQEEWKFIGKA